MPLSGLACGPRWTGCEVRDETDKLAALAVQGPTPNTVFKRMGFDGIEESETFRNDDFSF